MDSQASRRKQLYSWYMMLSLCVPMVDWVYTIFVFKNKNVINSVAESERSVDVKDLDLSNKRLSIEQARRIKWNVEDDVFCFKVVGQITSPTRHSMLSIAASMFDPLGYLSPFTLTGERLYTVCQGNIEWNDRLPAERLLEWETWITYLWNINLIEVTWCLIPSNFGKATSFSCIISQMHVQTDMGRMKVHRALGIAKARVAPLKAVTVPCFE